MYYDKFVMKTLQQQQQNKTFPCERETIQLKGLLSFHKTYKCKLKDFLVH